MRPPLIARQDAPELSAAHENGSMTGFDGPLVTASGSVTITNADVWTIESPAGFFPDVPSPSGFCQSKPSFLPNLHVASGAFAFHHEADVR